MSNRLISGIKPTGDIHIGNYFGMMKPLLEFQDEYESFVFIADLHALNQIDNPKQLQRNIFDIAAAYLAVGLDPKKVTLFRQSEISAHAELCVILNSIASMGLLERAHAYKDAREKGNSVNVGTFDYPILMAADILLYEPDIVPVGYDQQQHIEIMSDVAGRFNYLYGQTLKIAKGHVQPAAETVKGLDGQKMSKSYKNTIGLFDPPEVVKKKVMSIVTDSALPTDAKDPETDNIFALHRLFSQDQLSDLSERYYKGEISYKESKDILAENILKFLDPIYTKYLELQSNPSYVTDILEEGKKKAQPIAEATLEKVKKAVGL